MENESYVKKKMDVREKEIVEKEILVCNKIQH